MYTKKPFFKVLSVILSAVLLLTFAAACAEVAPSATKQASTAPGSSASASATTAASAAPQTIKIGFLTPLTGTSAALGGQVKMAADMLVDLINNKHPESHMALGATEGLPNLGNAKIQIIVADHKSDATTAVAEAKRLITEEKCVAITGEFTSALIKAVAVVTEQYKIPFLAAGSAVTLTDGSNPLKYFFRYGVNDATYIKDTFDFMTYLNKSKNAGIKTVAFVSEDSEFGANIVTQEKKYAAEQNYQVVENISYTANATNLTAEVLKIKAANPDVLIMASFSSDASLFINTCIEQKYTPKLLIGQRGGFIQPDYLKAMGDKNAYICTTGSWSADLNSVVSKELVALFPKYSNGVALSDGHVKDINCLLLAALAINQAKSTDGDAIAAALRKLDTPIDQTIIPFKGFTIDQYGQNTSANGIVAQFIDGKYQTVYPAEVAAAQPVYPMPAWK